MVRSQAAEGSFYRIRLDAITVATLIPIDDSGMALSQADK